MVGADLLQILVTGVTNGAVYGLIGLGFTLGFMVAKVVNFAHGELLMVGVLCTLSAHAAGLALALATVAGLLAAAALGAVVYVVAIRPVLRSEVISFAWLVTTLGTSIAIAAAASLVWGSGQRSFPQLVAGGVSLGGVRVTGTQAITLGLALAVTVAFELLRRRTLTGKVMAAVATDSQMAAACGVDRNRVEVVAFAASGALAALAGVLIAPVAFANPFMGLGFAIKGFVAIMLGGLGHPAGAIAGGLILGVSEAFATDQLGGSAADWFPFALLVLILLVRPTGLFGTPAARLAS